MIMTPHKSFISYFKKFLFRHKILFASLCLFFFSHIGLTLYIPQLFQKFIDGVSGGLGTKSILVIALFYLAFVFFVEILNTFRNFFMQKLSWSLTKALRSDMLKNLLQLDMTFYHNNSVGELVECVEGDVLILSNNISTFVLDIISNIIILFGILIIVFFNSVLLGCIFVLCSVISIIMMLRQSKKDSSSLETVRKNMAEVNALVTETITGREELHSLNAKDKILANSDSLHDTSFKNEKKFYRLFTFTMMLNNAITFIEKSCLVVILFYLLKDAKLSLGQTFMLYNYFVLLEWPLEMLAQNATTFQGLGARINRVFKLYIEKPHISFGNKTLDDKTYSVEFKDVSFAYDERDLILDNLSFKINAGDHCALQGRTGSGKSTLVKLLLKLYEPQSGEILLNGVPLNEFSQKSLAENIGYVSQSIVLFYASIRDNIRMFDQSISDEQIKEALKKSGMYEKIMALPGGLDYICEDGAANFSGGETQLLACARLFLKQSKIIILDESTAKLDNTEQEKIQLAFNELIENKTAIIIAHRTETLEKTNVKFLLENGKLSQGEKAILSEGGANETN